MTAKSIEEAKNIISVNSIDVAIIDLNLPDGNSTSLLQEGWLTCPTLILSSLVQDNNIIDGLDAGAEDYIFKPCSLAVLEKRLAKRLPNNNGELVLGRLVINSTKRTVHYNKIPIKLTSTEFNILYFLADNKNITFTLQEIYENVWDLPSLGTTTGKVHVYYLRRKIEAVAKEENYIITEFGKGYRFCYNNR